MSTESKEYSESMVMAVGDCGLLELCPASEAVAIPAVPEGGTNKTDDGWLIIPATLRALARKGEDPTALRLIEAQPADHDAGDPARVVFETAPFLRYTDPDEGRIMGTQKSCWLRNAADVGDSLFARLSEHERARMLKAVGF